MLFILFQLCESMKQNITNIINDSLDIWQHIQDEQRSVCVCMCVVVLHPFMFHSGRSNEQDLWSKCKSK